MQLPASGAQLFRLAPWVRQNACVKDKPRAWGAVRFPDFLGLLALPVVAVLIAVTANERVNT